MGMDKSDNKKLAIIGVGHIGSSLLNGLLRGGFKKSDILLSNTSETNQKVAHEADWIIIAVKPQSGHRVINEIKDTIKDKLLISVMAAVPVKSLVNYSGNNKQKIIRIMPNIPITYNKGVIGLYSNSFVSSREKNKVISLLSLLGSVIELKKESELELLTIISACGPAMVAYLITMFSQTALALGLSADITELLAVETFNGTLTYLQKTGFSPHYLQNVVATKGGVTEEVLSSLSKSEFYSQFEHSVKKGVQKIDKIKTTIIADEV